MIAQQLAQLMSRERAEDVAALARMAETMLVMAAKLDEYQAALAAAEQPPDNVTPLRPDGGAA